MSVIFLLITASALVAALFLAAFIHAVRNGQFDDDMSPAVRMLHDQPPRADRSDTSSLNKAAVEKDEYGPISDEPVDGANTNSK